MDDKELTYEQAVGRLEEIVDSLEQDRLGLDEVGERIREAQTLLKACRSKLKKVETDVKQILKDEQE